MFKQKTIFDKKYFNNINTALIVIKHNDKIDNFNCIIKNVLDEWVEVIIVTSKKDLIEEIEEYFSEHLTSNIELSYKWRINTYKINIFIDDVINKNIKII